MTAKKPSIWSRIRWPWTSKLKLDCARQTAGALALMEAWEASNLREHRAYRRGLEDGIELALEHSPRIIQAQTMAPWEKHLRRSLRESEGEPG